MPRATGRRLIGTTLFVVGGLSVIGIPLFWPLAWMFWRSAKRKEEERQRELDALDAMAE